MKTDMVSDLKISSKRIGKLYPILLDRHGNVLDGNHRIMADKDWPRVILTNIETERERLLVKLVSNVCRREVSSEEKTELLDQLAWAYLDEKVPKEKIIQRITLETGMSYRWVMKYISESFKIRPGIGGPKSKIKGSEVGKRIKISSCTPCN